MDSIMNSLNTKIQRQSCQKIATRFISAMGRFLTKFNTAKSFLGSTFRLPYFESKGVKTQKQAIEYARVTENNKASKRTFPLV